MSGAFTETKHARIGKHGATPDCYRQGCSCTGLLKLCYEVGRNAAGRMAIRPINQSVTQPGLDRASSGPGTLKLWHRPLMLNFHQIADRRLVVAAYVKCGHLAWAGEWEIDHG